VPSLGSCHIWQDTTLTIKWNELGISVNQYGPFICFSPDWWRAHIPGYARAVARDKRPPIG